MNTIKKIAIYALSIGVSALFLINFSWAGIPIEHWTQPSGAQVYLVQSAAIPMVDVQLDFDAGGRRDPADQAGLASVAAAMTAKGVRASTSPAEPALDENAVGEAWADLGASFVAHATSDRMSFALRSLTYPDLLAKAVQLAARQLAEPSFPADVWGREREGMQASIREANTRPATIAGRAFNQAVYGSHPYGYEMTQESLARIDVSQMAALYRQMILPCRAKVTVVGALNRSQADQLVAKLLGRLSSEADLTHQSQGSPRAKAQLAGTAAVVSCPALPAVAEVAPLQQPSEQRIAFESAQAHVLLGQPGFKRDDPDFFALTVGNYILGGGGFVSRLTNQVREKRGLSYSVYSYFSPALHAGAFTIGLQTRPDQADQALQVSREVLTRFVADGPTQHELKAAKDNLIGGFALRIDSNRKLLDNVANIAWNHLPLTYLDTWTQQIDKVTAADIRAAFQRKLQPQTMATVVLGGAPSKL
ncbi:MAG: pitrilysin family protein [Rhodoferax sp.]|uniref:M16 family metallopeptidase n=1 Tax=Rhodoferax sp. TaxID=50421 RepID=UPI00261E55EE|nr:pitrilysin family protein [Rhodoferax sp.]MDD2882672.1 pitrilysin family protein [Rhodoferax sp.]